MHKLSVQKLRWLFIAFFSALAIPSSILSFKANEQLHWLAIHQYRQDAQMLAQQIDHSLTEAIDREEARADTDYTFFVLAGTPEAKFVQRSELSKFPIESDLKGVIGYFQIDQAGIFSSPVLPSTYVQEEAPSALYGISREENVLRQQLVQSIRTILMQNKLVDVQKNQSAEEAAPTKPSQQSKELEDTALSELTTSTSTSTSSLIPSLTSSSTNPKNKKGPSREAGKETSESEAFIFEGNWSQTEAPQRDKSTTKAKAVLKSDGFSQLVASEKIRDRQQKLSRKKQSTGSRVVTERKKTNRKKQQNFLYSADNREQPRRSRFEKNYSPQQSLAVEKKSYQRLEQNQIQISLFESEIEPFKFSLLQSGHFVIYRQVWRKKQRLFQGALLSANTFLDYNVKKLFDRSSLSKIARVNILYANKPLTSYGSNNANESPVVTLSSLAEGLSTVRLSEPFGNLSLDVKLTKIPPIAGTALIESVIASLLLVLILGTYFLYRLAIRQSSLVQQQQNFVSSVSHELKTPLTSIRMYGEILKQGWASEEKRSEYYDYIYTESERLSRLIANVLQVSKVSHKALKLDLKPVEITELASLIHSKVDSQIAQSVFNLNLSIEPCLKTKTLCVDSDAFMQIIINLVDNAIKYSVKSETKQIDIAFLSVPKNKIVVSVRDFGPGIEKEQIEHVFELFYRSGNEMTREVTGTGIGLALVKELAELMQAKIKVNNRQPGVEFSLLFHMK